MKEKLYLLCMDIATQDERKLFRMTNTTDELLQMYGTLSARKAVRDYKQTVWHRDCLAARLYGKATDLIAALEEFTEEV